MPTSHYFKWTFLCTSNNDIEDKIFCSEQFIVLFISIVSFKFCTQQSYNTLITIPVSGRLPPGRLRDQVQLSLSEGWWSDGEGWIVLYGENTTDDYSCLKWHSIIVNNSKCETYCVLFSNLYAVFIKSMLHYWNIILKTWRPKLTVLPWVFNYTFHHRYDSFPVSAAAESSFLHMMILIGNIFRVTDSL